MAELLDDRTNIMPPKILVTGASGFIGNRVLTLAHQQGISLIAQSRSKQHYKFEQVKLDIDAETNWQEALVGVDCVIHCAAIVHQMQNVDMLTQYRSVNTEGTLNLARQAAAAGVRRFIFLSSIKVNGEQTCYRKPFRFDDSARPTDSYALSKYETEQQLLDLSRLTGLEVVIIRPPLVYGEGVKANFLSMLKYVRKQIPLPFGAVNNRRSMVYVDNLVDLILLCCWHPNAPGEIFLVSDDCDVSLTVLLRTIADAMNIKPVLLPVPVKWLYCFFSLLCKSALRQRLLGDLQIDIVHTKNRLNWFPPISFEQGIKRTVSYYLSNLSEK